MDPVIARRLAVFTYIELGAIEQFLFDKGWISEFYADGYRIFRKGGWAEFRTDLFAIEYFLKYRIDGPGLLVRSLPVHLETFLDFYEQEKTKWRKKRKEKK